MPLGGNSYLVVLTTVQSLTFPVKSILKPLFMVTMLLRELTFAFLHEIITQAITKGYRKIITEDEDNHTVQHKGFELS